MSHSVVSSSKCLAMRWNILEFFVCTWNALASWHKSHFQKMSYRPCRQSVGAFCSCWDLWFKGPCAYRKAAGLALAVRTCCWARILTVPLAWTQHREMGLKKKPLTVGGREYCKRVHSIKQPLPTKLDYIVRRKWKTPLIFATNSHWEGSITKIEDADDLYFFILEFCGYF